MTYPPVLPPHPYPCILQSAKWNFVSGQQSQSSRLGIVVGGYLDGVDLLIFHQLLTIVNAQILRKHCNISETAPPITKILFQKDFSTQSSPKTLPNHLRNQATNSILTDKVNRTIQDNVAMQVTQPGGQVCNLCKWRHLMANIRTNASDLVETKMM